MYAPSREISSWTLEEKFHVCIFYVPNFLIPRLLLRSCSAVTWPVKLYINFPSKNGKTAKMLNIGCIYPDSIP